MTLDDLADRLFRAAGLGAAPLAIPQYPGAVQVWERVLGRKIRITLVLRASSLIYLHPDYRVEFYPHPIDGWVVGVQYDPDAAFDKIMYDCDDLDLSRAYDAARRVSSVFTAKPVKQGKKLGPKDVASGRAE